MTNFHYHIFAVSCIKPYYVPFCCVFCCCCCLFCFFGWVVFAFDIVTCFGNRFFVRWGTFIEYCFIRGVVGQSLFYCFWQCFDYVWWMVWLNIFVSDFVIWFVVWLLSSIFEVESDIKAIYYSFVAFYHYFSAVLFK